MIPLDYLTDKLEIMKEDLTDLEKSIATQKKQHSDLNNLIAQYELAIEILKTTKL